MPPVTESIVASWANGKNLKFYFGAALWSFSWALKSVHLTYFDMIWLKRSSNKMSISSQPHIQFVRLLRITRSQSLNTAQGIPMIFEADIPGRTIMPAKSPLDWMVCACLRSRTCMQTFKHPCWLKCDRHPSFVCSNERVSRIRCKSSTSPKPSTRAPLGLCTSSAEHLL